MLMWRSPQSPGEDAGAGAKNQLIVAGGRWGVTAATTAVAAGRSRCPGGRV